MTKEKDSWFQDNYQPARIESFNKDGFLIIHNLLSTQLVEEYLASYERVMSRPACKHRGDLGSHIKQNIKEGENICQIMWPSLYEEKLLNAPALNRILGVVQKLLGNDMHFDFDMLINKLPHSNTATPWHQDESYWPNMSDKRAVSCWIALDQATIDNGCMWFVKGSHREKSLRPHRPVKEGHHVRCTDSCSEQEGEAYPLDAGSCSLHHGRTLHYTRGNSTSCHRRAYILNFRPQSMVEFERQQSFDHGKTI